MAASLHTFMDIFGAEFGKETHPIALTKIVIPIIQRDYAQGRRNPKVEEIRDRFLDRLLQAVRGNPVTLDFIYGDIDKDGVMTPLDGQQRLTTLFLLHWYGAKRTKLTPDKYAFLRGFSYETRYSARDFCEYLIEYTPSFSLEGPLSEEIKDQAWFPLDWEMDPTISAMLVTLDSIDEKFVGEKDLWSRLRAGVISFYFLPIKDMGLTDELYIRMNSRGKLLTPFERFKAEMESELLKVDEDIARRIIEKIDGDWTDLLWQYRGDDHTVDDEFLRYFHFVCDVIRYRQDDTPQGKKNDAFSLLKELFSASCGQVRENVQRLEEFFDCWRDLSREMKVRAFFDKRVSREHEAGKIKTDKLPDLFEDCLKGYGVTLGNGNRAFTLGRTVLLYAFVIYLLHRSPETDESFPRRLRIVHNLVNNSEYEISDSENRDGGNTMPAILKQVENIILRGEIKDGLSRNFNVHQLTEEKDKIKWVETHSEAEAESLFALEDHPLLYGQIGIVGLDHPEYFEAFHSLFHCDHDLVDCALLALGSYMQEEARNKRFQLGSSSSQIASDSNAAWRNLFHKSGVQIGFDATRRCLGELLARAMGGQFTDKLLAGIKDDYLQKCEAASRYDWRYYYIKYKVFRPGRYGKYQWEDFTGKPYELTILWAPRYLSSKAYQPFLKAIDEDHFPQGVPGLYLDFGDVRVESDNAGYSLREAGTNGEIRRMDVNQVKGIDTEDRIKKYLAQPLHS